LNRIKTNKFPTTVLLTHFIG